MEQLLQNLDKTIKKKFLRNQIKTQRINKKQDLFSDDINQHRQDIEQENIYDNAENNNLILDQDMNNEQQGQIFNHDYDDKQFSNVNVIIQQLFNRTIYDYSFYKYQIYTELLKKNYVLISYLDSGGQADVFVGYFQNDLGFKEDCVFKIYYESTNEEFQNEIEIMKSFYNTINVVKIIDSLQINQFFVLILEKCKYSLKYELQLFKQRKLIFTFEKLLQIIFDLLDGLIQFRIYNIIHLDIKPGNILISKQGYYCYSDFGVSFNQKKTKLEMKYYTALFAPPEQISNQQINFQTDVYSLGKTLYIVIDTFQDVNQEYLLNQKKEEKIIQSFQKIINDQMILIKNSERQNCQNLHEQFLQKLKKEEHTNFFSKYQSKLNYIIGLYEHDEKNDIQQLKLLYSLIYLKLIKDCQNEIQLKNNNSDKHLDFVKSLNNVGLCYFNVHDYLNSLKYYQESLNITKQVFMDNIQFSIQFQEMEQQNFGRNYSEIAKSLNNVGLCYIQLGDTQNGLKYSLESLLIIKQIFQGNHPDIAVSLKQVGQCYKNLGYHQNSLKYLLQSVEMKKQIYQDNHPDIVNSLRIVGQCYIDLGDNQKGLKYLLDSLEMAKQIFQGYHPDIATSLNNVGQCYIDLGDNQIGLKYLLESLEITKQIFQVNHPLISTSLNDVGQCYIDLGDNQNCLKYLLESLEMRKQIFQGNHPLISTSLNNVGQCYLDLGEYQNGLEYLLQSLQMRKLIFQGNHPLICASLNNVGQCYIDLGDKQNGLMYLLESLQMRKQVFQGNHPDIATSLNNVGQCYIDLGDNQNGLKYLLESLEMTKQIFQGNHPNISISLNNVGQCFMNLGDNQNGLKYLLESLEMTKQIFQGNHPDISTSLNNVGVCYINLGDNQNGLKYLLESLEMIKQIFQGNHPNISTSLNNVGQCYVNLGDNQNGMKYLLESLEMKKQLFKGNHPLIASSLNNIGQFYIDLGDNQNGLKYLLESLEMTKQIFQGNHPDIARSLNKVGQCYKSLGDNQNGLKCSLESLEMRKQIFQGNHPDIFESLNNVALCYNSLGDNQNGLKYSLESLEMRKQIFQGNSHEEYKNIIDMKHQLISLDLKKNTFQINNSILEKDQKIQHLLKDLNVTQDKIFSNLYEKFQDKNIKFEEIYLILLNKLSKTHQIGIAYTDIKPENIVISYDNEPFFIDFSAAVFLSDNFNDLQLFTSSFNLDVFLNKKFNHKEEIKLCDQTQLALTFLYLLSINQSQTNLFHLKNINELIQQQFQEEQINKQIVLSIISRILNQADPTIKYIEYQINKEILMHKLAGKCIDEINKKNKFSLKLINQFELYNKKIINLKDLNKVNVWASLKQKQNIQYTAKIQEIYQINNDKLAIIQEQGIADFMKISNMINQYTNLAMSNDQKNERFIEIEQFLQVAFEQLLEKLKAMHKDGIAHGDIKPQNLIITKDLEFHIIDFDQAVYVKQNIEQYLSVWTPIYNCQTVQSQIKIKKQNKLIYSENLVFLIDQLQFLKSFISIICQCENNKKYFFESNKMNELKESLFKESNFKFTQNLFRQYEECEKQLELFLEYNNKVKLFTKEIKVFEKEQNINIKQMNFTWFIIGIKENIQNLCIFNEKPCFVKYQLYDIEVLSLNRIISFYLNSQDINKIKFSDDLNIPQFLNIECDELKYLKQRILQECETIEQFNSLSVLSYYNLYLKEKNEKNVKNVKINIEQEIQFRKFIESLYLYPTIKKLHLDIDKTINIDSHMIYNLFQILEVIPQIEQLYISLINKEIKYFSKIISLMFNQSKHIRFQCSQIQEEDLSDELGFQINKRSYNTESCILKLTSSSINDNYLKFLNLKFQDSKLKYLILDLSLNDKLTSQGITDLIKATNNLQTVEKLRLDFSSCKNFNKDCIQSIIEVLRQNKRIKYYFNIQFCSNIPILSFISLLHIVYENHNQMNYSIQIRFYFDESIELNKIIKKIRQLQNKNIRISNKLSYYF